tara:strand:+ start:2899 stop:3189 length:291 start_codon:yes stop_codon:yes gene_type:complete
MMNESQYRQKILILYLGNSNLDSGIVGWSLYDGTTTVEFDPTGNEDPPYQSVLEAMRDGWRVIQIPSISAPQIGREHQTDYLQFEFVLERMELIDG